MIKQNKKNLKPKAHIPIVSQIEQSSKINKALIIFSSVMDILEKWNPSKTNRMSSVTHSDIIRMLKKLSLILEVASFHNIPTTDGSQLITTIQNNLENVIKKAISTGKIDYKNSNITKTLNAIGSFLPLALRKEVFKNSKLPSLKYSMNNDGDIYWSR